MSVALPHILADSRHSLRLKLTFWMLAVCTALQMALGAAIFLYERQAVVRASNSLLQQRADATAAGIRDAEYSLTDRELDRIAGNTDRIADAEHLVVILYSQEGVPLVSNRRPPVPFSSISAASDGRPQVSPARGRLPGFAAGPDSECRYLALPLQAADDRRFTLLAAMTDQHYESLVNVYAWVLGLSIPVGAIAAAVAGWLVSGIATAPIRHLRQLAGTLSPESLTKAAPTPSPAPELAALQADLSETRAKLLQAFQAQDRFVSSVSHELKTPIAVLLTEAQTLRPDQLPEDARRFVLSVVEEMRRLGSMVESFLTLTKIRGGKTTLGSVEMCVLNEAVMDAVEASNKMARQYNVTLVPDLADTDELLLISGSPELLRVMIDNLIRNAIRFSPEHHQVSIRVFEENGGCVIRIRDFGPAVPGPLIDKLFDRFVQAPGEEQLGRGHGLGLSIAQGIAELHRGRITVHNLEERGCEFSIWLPRAAPDRVSPTRAQVNGPAAPRPTR
ncbi:MAG: HAMP domain-containing histidine kinase [Phycisphaerales bacterium]|nr:HAMP domain-containing histidine kinase [Phycisphaerales bacterium]